MERIKNIHTSPYQQQAGSRGEEDFAALDLSGEHLGVRIEELPPGATSSYPHYHTAEEEHVLVLAGNATLHLDGRTEQLQPGDHVWFAAGEEVAHYLENTSQQPLKFLVFGERKADDVVFYPQGQVVLVKSGRGMRQFTYRPRTPDES